MKIISYILFVFVCCQLRAQNSNYSVQTDADLLKQMEYDWLMAEFKLDTALISSMMDEKFISIGLNSISNKQEELSGIYENMSQRQKNKHIVDSLYLDDMNVQIFNNTAIVTFISVTRGRINDVPFENRRTRMYDVWIKQNGKWKAVSSQVSPIR